MSIFPQLSDTYYVDNDYEILKMMDDTYNKYITINQSYWAEADIDMRSVAGDQTLYNDIYAGGPIFRKKQYSFNRLRRVVNMVSGYQRQHRKSTMVIPVHDDSQETADQFTKLLYHVNTFGSVLETISEAFEGACICGMNIMSVWLDYSKDPVNGDIKMDNCSFNSYVLDPHFKKKDLSDCNAIRTRKYLSRKQVMSLLPGREDEIKNMIGYGNKDGKFQFMPESYAYSSQDLLTYDEFWYLSTRSQKIIVDTDTGETIEWRGEDDDLGEFLGMYPQTIVVKNEIPTVKLAIVVQNKVMYHGPNPLGIDNYPFVPVWAYYMPEIPYFPLRVRGIIRDARDAQFLYNRKMIINLELLESQINSGWKYKENALVNPKDVFLSGQGKGLALKAEAQMTDVEQILPPQIPPSMLQLAETLGNEINQITGVNEELLGSASDEKAGILSLLRQGAGLVTLQGLFDNLDQSQKILGKLCIDIIQANWTPGKVARIISEEPSQEFYNRAFSKYDAMVEEAPLTATQKQLAFQQCLYLKEMGVPIPTSYLLKNMQLPDKDDLMEQIDAQEKAEQQQQQQMAQMQLQAAQVDNETKLGFADAQHAQAQERLNKIRLDQATAIERMEKSEQDKTGAFLNLIKAVKEIEGMDISQIAEAMKAMLGTQQAQHDHDKANAEIADMQIERQQQQQQQQMAQQQAGQQQQVA